MVGTTLVETPFLLHLAGTKGWPRFTILSVGFGIMVSSLVLLFALRRRFSPGLACLAGLNTAYLANAALCLVVYAGAAGGFASRSGWYVCMVIVWPMFFDLAWLFLQAIFPNSSSILGHHRKL